MGCFTFRFRVVRNWRMKEEPQVDEEATLEEVPKLKGWNWGMIVIGVFAGVVFLVLSAPMVIRCPKAANRTQAINNAKQVGLALLEFDQEFGSFPNDETAALIKKSTGTSLDLSGGSSNALFRQLIAYGIQSEDIFYCLHPQGIHKPDGDISPGKALEAGEVGWSYFSGQSISTVDPLQEGRPLLAAPMVIGTETFWTKPFKGKAVILRLDNSVEAPLIRDADRKVSVGSGKTLFDVGEDTVWGVDGKIDLRHPEPGR